MFRFRLQRLLQLREAFRNERRAELARALQAQQKLQGWMDDLTAKLAFERQTRTCAPGPVQVDRQLESLRYQTVLQMNLLDLERKRLGLEAEIDRLRAALVEADREVKVLIKLRDRKQREEQAAENRRETKFLDEVAGRNVTARLET